MPRFKQARGAYVISMGDLKLAPTPFATGGGGRVFRGRYMAVEVAAKQIWANTPRTLTTTTTTTPSSQSPSQSPNDDGDGDDGDGDDDDSSMSLSQRVAFDREATILATLHHPSIVVFYGVASDQANDQRRPSTEPGDNDPAGDNADNAHNHVTAAVALHARLRRAGDATARGGDQLLLTPPLPLVVGDRVTWAGSDDDVPAGAVGEVVGFKDDGKRAVVSFTREAFAITVDALSRADEASRPTAEHSQPTTATTAAATTAVATPVATGGIRQRRGSVSAMYMVFEWCGGGDLRAYSRSDHFTIDEFCRVSLEVLGAVAYLHDQGVAHRDLVRSWMMKGLLAGGACHHLTHNLTSYEVCGVP